MALHPVTQAYERPAQKEEHQHDEKEENVAHVMMIEHTTSA
jgi:hypothetical protein